MENPYITNDLSFAAYLSINGVRIITARRFGKTYKFEFAVHPDIERLSCDYISSESAKFDAAVRNLKRLLFGEKE